MLIEVDELEARTIHAALELCQTQHLVPEARVAARKLAEQLPQRILSATSRYSLTPLTPVAGGGPETFSHLCDRLDINYVDAAQVHHLAVTDRGVWSVLRAIGRLFVTGHPRDLSDGRALISNLLPPS